MVGRCRGAMPRFFYNSATKKCERFLYGGCDGNDNNFETMGECQQICDGTVCLFVVYDNEESFLPS